MPLDDATRQKADQLAHRFFSKFSILVDDARSNIQGVGPEAGKTDKWASLSFSFNIETVDADTFKDHLKTYRSVSSLSTAALQPLELQVLLTVPELAPNQVLTYRPQGRSRLCVEPPGGSGQVRNIILERWSCKFLPPPPSSSTSSVSDTSSVSTTSTATEEATSVPLPTVYKHAMSTFRSLYTLLQVLPSSRVCRRVRRAGGSGLGVSVRVSGEAEGRVLGFGEPIAQNGIILPTQSFDFSPVPHPMGMLSLSVTYLSSPQLFELDSREALLSSAFLSAADKTSAGNERVELDVPFTPTLARNREAQSQTQSANLRALGAARSPPRNVPAGNGNSARRGYGFFENAQASGSSSASGGGPAGAGNSGTSLTGIVDRFATTGSPRGATGLRSDVVSATGAVQRSQSAGATSTEIPVSVVGPGESSIGAGSTGSLSSREEVGGTLARYRRESSTSVGRDLPSSPSPSSLSGRRPSMNVINPFKSSTLVNTGSPSSASLRQTGSPLAGPSLPSARGLTFPSMGSPGQSSSSGIAAFRSPSSPGFKSPLAIPTPSSLRGSPPIAGSGIAQERRMPLSTSPGSASASSVSGSSHVATGSTAAGVPVRRRYSSQLSHRYDREKAGSEGASSGGSAGAGSVVDKVKAARERKDSSREKPITASYLSNVNTDDDDLSSFVQDIDSRRPLAGGVGRSDDDASTSSARPGSSPGKAHRGSFSSTTNTKTRDRTISDISDGTGRLPSSGLRGLSTSPGRRGLHFERTLSEVAEREREPSSPADILTNGNAIDERLRRMNEAFRASLNGLTRRASSSPSSTPASATPGPSSGDEQKSPSSAAEESPTTPLAHPTRVLPLEGRERTSALSRAMRMNASPTADQGQQPRSSTTPAVLVATQSEDGGGDGHHVHRSSSGGGSGGALQSRRTRSEFDVPSTGSGSDNGTSGDRHHRVSTRIRVTPVTRPSTTTAVSGRESPSNTDYRRASGDRPRNSNA
ncbi:hypothetical protein SCHPADRAFT_993713 [Schizopora paradoxa]|uniref:Autophagy-related protein 13 n=1 Tax=Schizopora paradoxa TaxID=27342 RepID=A0A0H2S2N0_9AGAM|nr:hypothetical protein SCHPADRAFT_993713 [Schizopora paradoxa]